MKRLILMLLAFISFNLSYSQDLVSSEYLGLIDSLAYEFFNFPIPVIYDTDYYKVTYTTTGIDGESAIASGAVIIPNAGDCNSFPLVAYCHGTVLKRYNVPSEQNLEGLSVGAISSAGFVAVAPDYLGLGESEGVHPYVHAETQATATLDLISAGRQLLDSLSIQDNGEVFITGYSQGGHAAMASLKYAQDNDLLDEIGIVAGAPASGPYNLSGTQADIILSDQPYSNPGYIVYLLIGYNAVYQNLFTELGDVIEEPYATDVLPYFDGEQNQFDMGDVNELLPDFVTELLRDSVLTNFENNPNHPLRIALEDNDNYNWTPTMPLRMYYCTGDEQVFFSNSVIAEESMLANGAENVFAINVLEGGDHADCVLPAVENIYAFFDSLSTDCQNPLATAEEKKPLIRMAPNPARDQVRLFIPFREVLVEIYSADGNLIFEKRASGPEIKLDVSGLARGQYILSVISGSERYSSGLIVAGQ